MSWYTTINGHTSEHATKRLAVRAIRIFLAGEHRPITRIGHTYSVGSDSRK